MQEAFDEFFYDRNQVENGVWRGLLVMAVGMGALATMVAVR